MSYEIAISRTEGRSPTRSIGGFSTQINISRSDDEPLTLMNFKTKAAEHARSAATSTVRRVKRRLHGFFVQEEGSEGRVAFVDNGQLIHYYLPLKLLKDGGVTAENQPFELDEFEATVEGVLMKGYKVRAAARPQDSYPDELTLDARSKENMNFLLSRPRNVAH